MDIAECTDKKQGGNHETEPPRGGASSPRRAVEPLAVAGQVAAGDPALHRAVLLVDRVRPRHPHRVLCESVYPAPHPAPRSPSTGECCAGGGGSAPTPTAPWGPTATRHSASGRSRATPPRWTSPT